MRALFTKSATTLGLVEQAFWRVPLSTEWIGASSFEVILAGPSRHSSTGTFASGTSGSQRISLILSRRRSRRRIRLCRFCTLFDIVTETATVSFRRLPRWFSTANNLQEFFAHAVLSPDSWPRFVSHFPFQTTKFFIRKFCLILLFSPSSSICDNQLLLSSDESPNCTIPIRSWVSQALVFLTCTILPRCHQMGFNRISSHFEWSSWV